jgi:DNA mismatch repair protein MutL
MSIHQLAPDVAAKIAAGEVVERPASIVKELVENAIDAGATRISVDLQGGGSAYVRVTDDGGGIARDDLALAFARHATSKIHDIGDLSALHTLGFRGEALASIGAVAAVTLASRPPDASQGARLTMEHGALGAPAAIAMPPGTIVTVRDLFARVPARLKFLKSAASEASACQQAVARLALSHPEVQFVATHDGRVLLRTPGDGSLLNAVAQVFGLPVAEQMVPLVAEDPSAEEAIERPPAVTGLTSRPACYRSNRNDIIILVNRRWVRSASLTYAVEEAYHSLLLAGRHPISVVSIAIDPALVDVNVHPAKTEVKFARERQVYAVVQRAVREAIVQTTEAPVISSRAFSTAAPAPHPSRPAPLLNPPPAPGNPAALWDAATLRRVERPASDPSPVAAPPASPRLPALRVLGQVSQSYIITEGPDGVYLIDQHAAHERILLEKMVAQWRAHSLPSQALLEPVVVELPSDVLEAIEERLDALRGLGFDIELFGAGSVLVRAVPAPLAERAAADLADLLPELAGAEEGGHTETWEEHALANVACKAAIKAGQQMSLEEQRALVRQLETVDARHSCCHGRPTTIHLSIEALAREFARR